MYVCAWELESVCASVSVYTKKFTIAGEFKGVCVREREREREGEREKERESVCMCIYAHRT